MKDKNLWVAAILLLALTTACGSAAPAAPTQGSSPVMPVATETVTPNSAATTAPAGSANSSSGFPAGSFTPNHPVHTKTLVFNQDGTYQFLGIVEAGQTAAIPVGTYAVSGDHVTFLDDPGSATVCQKQTGDYTWTFDGSALVFKMVNDYCDERRIDLTNSTWTKQP